jgi:hypothetical protein
VVTEFGLDPHKIPLPPRQAGDRAGRPGGGDLTTYSLMVANGFDIHWGSRAVAGIAAARLNPTVKDTNAWQI